MDSPNVKYTESEIESVYNYETTELVHENRNGSYQWIVKPKTVQYEFKTDARVPKLGYFSYIQQINFSLFCFSDFFKVMIDLFLWVYVVGLCLLDGEGTMAQLSLLVSLQIGSEYLALF